MKNLFIVFDGIDGSGKSTHLGKLHNYLFQKDKRIKILTTREPTFGRYGKQIREMLQGHKDPYSDSRKLFELYVKDREDHVTNVILPFLEKDEHNISIVLCDRYYYSTIAYQAAQGEDIEEIVKQNKKFLKPDVALIFDISPEIALNRISQKRKTEKFEQLEFMKKLAENFHGLKEILDDHIIMIDSSGSEEATFEKVKKEVDKFL